MAKVYDISHKITNERPTLKLGEGKVYEIDDSKNTMLLLGQKMKQGSEDIEVLDDIVKMTLGEKAAKEIDAMKLSVSSYQSIVIAIMAAAAGEEFEAAEARFRREQKKALK
jgi:hypothetical protein